MDITVLVRARDEELRIGKFCEAYRDADRILVADGGSEDKTKYIASCFSNVVIRDFPGRTPMKDGSFRNNDSDHINFLLDWAKEYKTDWLILDDCDCRPNYKLKEDYRNLFSYYTPDVFLVTRLYTWGLDKHFPYMAKPGKDHKDWEPSLWAWRADLDLYTINVPPAWDFRIGKEKVNDFHVDTVAHDLLPPYALLHYSWDDPERVEKKVKNYRESGLIPGMLHPKEFAGPIEDLPEWARE